jgi:hypothetical protein
MENAVKIPVKTQWQGQIALRKKQIDYAKAYHDDIIVEHNRQFMRIPWNKIDELGKKRSQKKTFDYYGKDTTEYLFYFKWIPEPPKQKEFLF